MISKEIDLLNLENELLNTGRKLNDLIYESQIASRLPEGQGEQTSPAAGLYQDKIDHLEAHLSYLQGQLATLRRLQSEAEASQLRADSTTPDPQMMPHPQAMPAPQAVPVPQVMAASQTMQNPQAIPDLQAVPNLQAQASWQPKAVSQKPERKPQEYEKMFGKNFMGIFASVLVFISLIIFATLVIPYLTDTMKLTGMYILSFSILGAGLLLYRKHRENKFYIAVIGCGAGSLYLSLLLSNLYFKVLGDIALYCFILVWAVLVKSLTRVRNLVFQIIGQAGIFIATVLGTILCVADGDEKKFFVLTIFYLISACVFSEIDKEYVHALIHSRKGNAEGEDACEPPCYEHRLCSHISKALNAFVFVVGFSVMEPSGYKVASVLLLMLYMLLEFYFSFREKCRFGIGFHLFTIVNSLFFILLFNAADLLESDYTFVFMYLTAIALLFYLEKKDVELKPISQIWGLFLVFIACCGNRWMREHLYAYLTVIPFMAVGRWKDKKVYLYASCAYLFGMLFVLPPFSDTTFRITESFLMTAVVYAVFLIVCRKFEDPYFKISGYIVLCMLTAIMVDHFAYAHKILHLADPQILYDSAKSKLLAFYAVSVIHLLLSKIKFFGEKQPENIMLYIINAILMFAGVLVMHDAPWRIPTILITVLLFVINSKELLQKHKNIGYYIALKYTVLMVSILGAFDVVNYAVSICLLIFAVVSIVAGFYKDNAAFRLYGLILSMISVIKLIMVDISYDSTLENAVSFFVCGVLCFVISFIYHKIDVGFKNK